MACGTRPVAETGLGRLPALPARLRPLTHPHTPARILVPRISISVAPARVRLTLRCDGVSVPEYGSGSGLSSQASARKPPHCQGRT
jgi:hypothetical protein